MKLHTFCNHPTREQPDYSRDLNKKLKSIGMVETFAQRLVGPSSRLTSICRVRTSVSIGENPFTNHVRRLGAQSRLALASCQAASQALEHAANSLATNALAETPFTASVKQ